MKINYSCIYITKKCVNITRITNLMAYRILQVYNSYIISLLYLFVKFNRIILENAAVKILIFDSVLWNS